MIRLIAKGDTISVGKGDYFQLLLPDGTVLYVEQTADDFQIVKAAGVVCYSRPTSESAKKSDGWYYTANNVLVPLDQEVRSGRN